MVITLTQERIRIIGGIGVFLFCMIAVNFLLSLGDDVGDVKVSKPVEHESVHVVTKSEVIEMPPDNDLSRIFVKKGTNKTIYKVQWWSFNSNEWVDAKLTYDNLSDAELDRDSWIDYLQSEYLLKTNIGEWVIHDE